MSHSNGYDAWDSEIRSIRTELREVDERRIEDRRQVTQVVGSLHTLMDRVANSLGRIDTIEMQMKSLLTQTQTIITQGRALIDHFGVKV